MAGVSDQPGEPAPHGTGDQPPPGQPHPPYPMYGQGYGYGPSYGQPWGQPVWGQPVWQPPQQEHPRANEALVLGLVSLVGGLTFWLPLLAAPWAWATGRRVVREIDASGGRLSGRGQAQAGYVMGVVGTVVLALVALVVAGIVLFLVRAGDGGTTLIDGSTSAAAR